MNEVSTACSRAGASRVLVLLDGVLDHAGLVWTCAHVRAGGGGGGGSWVMDRWLCDNTLVHSGIVWLCRGALVLHHWLYDDMMNGR